MAAFPKRQVVLFLAAVLFPSAMLVALGLRIIGQERELAEKRLADDRRRVVDDERRALVMELQTITSEVVAPLAASGRAPSERTYGPPSVDLVAMIVDGSVTLPWEEAERFARARASLSRPDFLHAIARGEHAELAVGNAAAAIDAYRTAVANAGDAVQAAYGRLLLARALKRAGRIPEASALYGSLLELPSDAMDDQGVPIALYAAAALTDWTRDQGRVLRRVRREIESTAWHAPSAAYLLRALLPRIDAGLPDSGPVADASALDARLASEITVIERATALRTRFATLGLSSGTRRSANRVSPWVPFAEGAWLVAATRVPGTTADALIAVNTHRFLAGGPASTPAAPPAMRFQLHVGRDGAGEPLGPSLPGLSVVFTQPAREAIARLSGSQRSLSLVVLLLVLSVTLFGGYLLWRDVRREARLAELRSHFVSSVSHELKTPLTAIRMFAETLRARERADPAMQAEYLDTIVGESERLTRLLSNVLDHSKIERDQKRYRRELASLADIVRRAAAAMQYPLTQGGFNLSIDIAEAVPRVAVDADAVEQATLNLLTNAMKYSGGSRDIDLRLRLASGQAVIEVTDRGIGVPAHERDRLTEKFYRVRSPENDRIPGTGLGLALVEHMARAHGGHLEIRSAVGQGSTFAIHLPLADGA